MALRFEDGETVLDGTRRMLTEAAAQAHDVATKPGADVARAVHEGRKRCKEMRALLRLVRYAFEDWSEENARLRDSARALAGARDAHVLLQTHDGLVRRFSEQVDRTAFAPLRRGLMRRRRDADGGEEALRERLRVFGSQMAEARGRYETLLLQERGFPALRRGVARAYGRARRAMVTAREERSAEAFHEWRKCVKVHRFHVEILEPVWPRVFGARRKELHELSDLLGEHHDLTVYEASLPALATGSDRAREVQVLLGLSAQRREAVEHEALVEGERCFAEKPGALAKRWQRYWQTWRAASPRPATAPA
jgi:CHAD domain-containing protein